MIKKILIAMTAIIAIIIILAALFGQKILGPKTTGAPITLGRYYWPGDYWLEIAYSKGYFKQAGLNVQLVDTNPDYYKSVKETAEGKIDANNFYLYDFVYYNAQGADLVGIINADVSYGVEAIVARKEIENVRDLRGKRIGVTKNSTLEYLLSVALERAGLSLNDTIIEDMPAEKTIEEFSKGNIDAFIAWEPYPAQAVEKGLGKRIFDTTEVYGAACAVLALKRNFVEKRPQDVQALVSVWHKTTDFIKKNPKEAFKIIADIYKVAPLEVENLTHKDKILDLDDNLVAFTHSKGFESLHGTAGRINNYLAARGITDKKVDREKIFDGRFIRKLKK